LRAAWTNTLARPNYFDLVPYTVINQEDEELEVGNPELKPTTSMNLDLMAEYYFPSIGIISGGLFYKDITDFIVTSNSDVTGGVYDGWEISQPINGGNASIFGIEIALKKQLDFLPGFLSNIGIYGNYTYTASEIRGDLRIEGREGEKLPLPGSPKNSWNASLSYDGKKLYLRASLNYSGDYIEPDEMGDEAFFDRYYDKSLFLDLNGSYAITPYLRVFAEAKNLTNQPLRYYQGIPDRIMQEEFYNWRFTLGLKLDL
jgi:TonB-dependent receptor